MHGLESVFYQSSPMAASNQYRKMQTRPSLGGAVRSGNGCRNHGSEEDLDNLSEKIYTIDRLDEICAISPIVSTVSNQNGII